MVLKWVKMKVETMGWKSVEQLVGQLVQLKVDLWVAYLVYQ